MRIPFHASATYDRTSATGGANGASLRFEPEASDPMAKGTGKGIARLREKIKENPKYGSLISTADLWILAGCVALEVTGGPVVVSPLHQK